MSEGESSSTPDSWWKRVWKRGWRIVLGLVAIVTLVGGIIALKGVLDEATQDPIRVEYGDLSRRNCSPVAAVTKDAFDPSKDMLHYESGNELIYSNPSLEIDVVSQVEDETLKVAPYLLVKTTDIKRISEKLDYLYSFPGQCGVPHSAPLLRC